jgi:quercetin dioxygenase-like cupin family protein
VVISQATLNGVDYITKEITIQPGGDTGWHYHDGRVFGVVREGTLTRTLQDCSVVSSPEGSAVTEESGPGHAHIGRNLGPGPVVLWVDYIEPAGTPQAVDVPDPGCG